jgi:Cu-Zn family superoxide dismutase
MIARYSALLLASSLLGACATASEKAPATRTVAGATLRAADGTERGTASLTSAGTQLSLVVNVSGLSAAEHGAHLHTVGRCDAPDFTSAGPHLNPHGKQHGAQNPLGSHLGDLPNLAAGADGKASLTIPLAGTAADVEALLFDADGTAVVIHAGPDDYRTDPSGNSGGRIACGVLTRS